MPIRRKTNRARLDELKREAPTLCFLIWILTAGPGSAAEDGTTLTGAYAAEIDRTLNLPPSEEAAYGVLLARAVADKHLTTAQYLVLVDRSEFVQAVMIYWMSPELEFRFIGASPASTGKPGAFDHFKTPTGVFEHTIDNPDFRAEGTLNENGIRGYGIKGRRVFDFGWQQAVRGWGRGGESTMRLQMHATDPDVLENRLGTAQSKGCIRIPATLNVFLDHYGILDGDYEAAMAEGKSFWVLPQDRRPTPWSGRYLVIVDTQRTARPAWARPPRARKLPGAPKSIASQREIGPAAEVCQPTAASPGNRATREISYAFLTGSPVVCK